MASVTPGWSVDQPWDPEELMLQTLAELVVGVPVPCLQTEGHGEGTQVGNRGLSMEQPKSVGPTGCARCAWSLQDAKGWRCRLCTMCRAGLAGVNHVRGRANESWSGGCRVTHTFLRQLLLVLSPGCCGAHRAEPAAGQRSWCPSDPTVASVLGHQHRVGNTAVAGEE